VTAVVQDLNRVIHKPYTENKDDTSGRPDEVITVLLAAYQSVCFTSSERNFLPLSALTLLVDDRKALWPVNILFSLSTGVFFINSWRQIFRRQPASQPRWSWKMAVNMCKHNFLLVKFTVKTCRFPYLVQLC